MCAQSQVGRVCLMTLLGQLAGVRPAQALPWSGQLVFSRAQTLCPRKVAKGKEEGEAVPTLEVGSPVTLP